MKAFVLLVAATTLSACGKISSDTFLLGADQQQQKVRCSGDHEGFYVCLSTASAIASAPGCVNDAAIANGVFGGLMMSR